MIEVGEYVRTKNGKIRTVKSTVAQYYITDRLNISDNNQFTKEDIVKHSKNIIDLIEVGDYVNCYRVVDIMEDIETGKIHLEMTSDYTNEIIGDCTIYNDDIKSIVTHEQFASMEYKVGEE